MKENKFNKRVPIKTPDSLINHNKTCNYGTFKTQFKCFNFQNYRLFNLPKFIKKHRLTRWEVVEASFGNFMFLGVVYKVGVLSFNMFVLYDNVENKVYNFGTENLFIKKSKIAKTLLNKEVSEKTTKNDSIKFINEFENNKCQVIGHAKNKTDSIIFDFNLLTISEPSIVSIPLTNNNPLYTEKDLMRMYLSTEFETIKNDIKKDLKLEFTNKFDKELKKIKNTNIKFYLLLIISLSSFSISCFILIKNLY